MKNYIGNEIVFAFNIWDINSAIDTFLSETDADMVAVAFGNAHGIYKGNPKLDYNIVKYVTDRTDRPFVVHGGSGMSDEIIKRLVQIKGVKKINISTDVKVAYREGILNSIENGNFDRDGFQAIKVENDIHNMIEKMATDKMKLLDEVEYHNEKANIVGGSNNLGGGLIEWVKQCYYLKDEYPYEIMEKEAAESDIGARGLIFLPYLLGERTPIWDDDARGVFLGLERMHTRKDMTRAVFESTGFIDLSIIDAIKENGTDIDNVRLSGGLARINLISQIKADILGKNVLVLSEFETTASGAAMIVLKEQGVCSSMKAAADKFATIRMIINPNMDNHKKYMYMYELYKESYKTLKPLFKKRKEMVDKLKNDKEIQIENL